MSSTTASEVVTGRVLRMQSGFYTVETERGELTCQLRGRLKKGRAREDIVAVGDLVRVIPQDSSSGTIESVEPRYGVLERTAPSPRGPYRQVILANLEQVVFVFACAHPAPHLRMLDRFLVIAEKQHIPPLVVANKVDLLNIEAAREIFSIYEALGYPVLYTSVVSGEGIDQLRLRLQGRLSGVAGPSGVGKSSLLNAVQPGLRLQVGDTSGGNKRKGMHTTVVRRLLPLEGGGYVADLPGLRSLALWDTQPEELDGYFPELRPLVANCQFSDCAHQGEPGCAVQKAVEEGQVHPARYESYLRLRSGED